MKYRKEIDGLRAVAVLPVIYHHSGLPLLDGGFLGVDVFFVISGYLISSIILEEKTAGKFSLSIFYERRLRRLIPALGFMLFLTSATAVAVMLPFQLKEYGQSIIATLAFSANIFFWLKTDYWSPSADLTPLLHVWSLGIEEQFYLLFPFLLIYLGNKKLIVTCSIIIGVSFAGMIYARASGNGNEAFYLLPFRAWELVAGAIAATIASKIFISDKIGDRLNLIALIALIFSFLHFDKNTNPIVLYGTPVIATFFIIASPCRQGYAVAVLRNELLVRIGLISYSLYLFHQPIFALARIVSYGSLGMTQVLACLIAILILSTLSYKYVELPFRDRSAVSNRAVLIFAGTIAAVFALLGAVLNSTEGLKEWKLSLMPSEARVAFEQLAAEKTKRAATWEAALKSASTDFYSDNRLKILFVGDSVSEDLFVAGSLSDNLIKKAQLRRLEFDDECMKNLVTGGNEIGRNQLPCNDEKKRLLTSKILNDAQVIIIAELWLNNAAYLAEFLKLQELRSKNIIVYLNHSFVDINSLLLYLARSKTDYRSSKFKEFVYHSRHQGTLSSNSTLSNISKKYSIKTINSNNYFCNNSIEQCNLFDTFGHPSIIDTVHISDSAISDFSLWFSSRLENTLGL